MSTPFLPQRIDNTYRGQKIALWILGALLLIKAGIGINSTFNAYSVATTADGIPLDLYPPAAAQTVVAFFSIWGLEQLLFALVGIVALMRYRAATNLLFLFSLVEFASRKLIFHFLPIAATRQQTGFVVNLVLVVLMVAGFALSLWQRGTPPSRE